MREEALKRLETVYGPDSGLAGGVLLATYHQLCQKSEARDGEASPEEAAARQTFLEALAAEIACFEALLDLHENVEQKLALAEREAQNALSEADTRRLTRREAFLDRQFDGLMKQFNDWRRSRPKSILAPRG